MDRSAKIFFTAGYVYGGSTAIVATPQTQPMDPMFPPDGNWEGFTPGCWMQKHATWYGPDFFPDQRTTRQPSQYILGEDVGLFEFPTIDPAQGTPEGSADALMVLVDRPEVRAVAEYLATPAGLRTGPRRQRPVRQHHHARRVVRGLLQAEGRVRDRQPPRASASTLPT